MTDAEALSATIVHDFEVWVKGLLTRLWSAPETPLLEVLREVQAGLRPIIRALVWAAGRCVSHYQSGPECPDCGCTMRSKGLQDRGLTSELGEVTVPVRRWRCPQCGRERQPWWEAAGLVGSWTQGMWEVAMGLAVGLTYRTAEYLMGKLGCPVSDTTLQGWVVAHGGAQAATAEEEARRWERLEGEAPPPVRPERLYHEEDGCKVRLLEEGWKEVRVGVLFETAQAPCDAEGKAPPVRWKRILATLSQGTEDAAQADSFMRRMGAELDRCGVRYAREVVSLSDGAAWIWDRVPNLVPLRVRGVEILDFFHAAENLARAPRAVYGKDEGAFKACFEWLRHHLKLSDLPGVWRRLTELELRAVGDQAEEVRRVKRYVQEHRHRMDYLRLKLDGYYIGSGAVESGCKLILARVRGAGMRWKRERLEAMLTLRAQFLSEQWAPDELPRAA